MVRVEKTENGGEVGVVVEGSGGFTVRKRLDLRYSRTSSGHSMGYVPLCVVGYEGTGLG